MNADEENPSRSI